MKNNDNQDFDQHFKDSFGDFEQRPETHNWNEIRNAMSSNIDHLFEQKLGAHEESPSSKVWDGVQKSLPLSLLLRRHLNTLSRIAAMLVIGMICLLFIRQNKIEQQTNAVAEQQTILVPSEETSIQIEQVLDSENYLVEINMEDNQPEDRASDKHAIRDKELKMAEDLLADLLGGSDDFLDLIDQKKIEEAISPALEPTIHTAVTMLEKNVEDETPELEIKIPLIVVEQYEIEEMINVYDKAQLIESNPNR